MGRVPVMRNGGDGDEGGRRLAEVRGQRKRLGLLKWSGRSQEQKLEREETAWGAVLAEIFRGSKRLGNAFGLGS